MPPGGETFRFSPRFSENVPRHGSHEWLPYSKEEVHLKSSNANLPRCCIKPINTLMNVNMHKNNVQDLASCTSCYIVILVRRR